MNYLLLGSDDFLKKEYIKDLVAKEKLEVCSFFETDQPDNVIRAATDINLFGGKKLIKVYNFFSKGLADQNFLEKLFLNSNIVIFLEDKLDKRKAETKKILANKNLKVLEFNTPIGLDFRKWLENRIIFYNLKLSGKSLELFLQRIGFGIGEYGPPLYSLWQVDSELQKLKAFSGEGLLTEQNISDLISEKLEENVFVITNAIGDKNRALTIKTLTDYMDHLVGDEKAKVISLSGLLAEQFRSMLIIQDMFQSNISEKEISAATGYSPGRVFIYKKLSGNFPPTKLKEALVKLELLDGEVKTSSGPATLQLLMIIESLTR
ncbi:MAG: DNA polymerase III subunit delta [Candidatus Doudnabacteria bacterium]